MAVPPSEIGTPVGGQRLGCVGVEKALGGMFGLYLITCDKIVFQSPVSLAGVKAADFAATTSSTPLIVGDGGGNHGAFPTAIAGWGLHATWGGLSTSSSGSPSTVHASQAFTKHAVATAVTPVRINHARAHERWAAANRDLRRAWPFGLRCPDAEPAPYLSHRPLTWFRQSDFL